MNRPFAVKFPEIKTGTLIICPVVYDSGGWIEVHDDTGTRCVVVRVFIAISTEEDRFWLKVTTDKGLLFLNTTNTIDKIIFPVCA